MSANRRQRPKGATEPAEQERLAAWADRVVATLPTLPLSALAAVGRVAAKLDAQHEQETRAAA